MESVTSPTNVNETLTALFDTIPLTNESVTPASSIDLNRLLPSVDSRNYYHYSGSLTTPPYTEGIEWYVFKTPIKILKADLDKYIAKFPRYERLPQDLNGRTIFYK